jgi:hypothetical protein
MTALTLTPAASAAQASNVIREQVRSLVIHGADPDKLLAAVAVDMEIAPLMDIDSDDQAEELQTMLGRLSTVAAAIESERTARKAPLLDAARWLDGGYQPMTNRISGIIIGGKAKLTAYAKAVADAARVKAEAEAAARRAEAAAKAAEEAAAVKAAEEAAKAAKALRDAGNEQAAQAAETQAMVAVDTARQNTTAAVQAMYVAPVRAPAPAVKGGSVAWKAVVTDKAALVRFVGELIAKGDLSMIDLLDVNEKAANALAKLQKEHMNVPGLSPQSDARQAIRKVAVAA